MFRITLTLGWQGRVALYRHTNISQAILEGITEINAGAISKERENEEVYSWTKRTLELRCDWDWFASGR